MNAAKTMEDAGPSFPLPSKIPRLEPNWSKCICHITGGSGRLSTFNDKSWTNFKNACEKRKDNVYTVMKDHWNNGPRGLKHKLCYRVYVNKSVISKVTERQTAEKENEEPIECAKGDESLHTCSVTGTETKICVSGNEFNKAVCVFCKCSRKRSFDGSYQLLIGFERNEDVYNKILLSAQLKDDNEMIAEIMEDKANTAQFFYHKRCYLMYLKNGFEKDVDLPPEREIYGAVDIELFSFVKTSVIDGLGIEKMSDIRDMYIGKLEALGIVNKHYRTEKIKKKLVKNFQEQITFWKPNQRCEAELLFSSDLKAGDVIDSSLTGNRNKTKILYLKADSTDQQDDSSSIVYKAAAIIRAEIMKMSSPVPWPPTPDNIRGENIKVPDALYNLLSWTIRGDKQTADTPETVRTPKHEDERRKILSVAQDIVHCTTGGRIKNPKHLALGITVKHLTGSAHLIDLLNKFGHTLSYCMILEAETAFAEKSIEEQQRGGVFIPKVIKPHVPAIFCWDNNDINEATLSGYGTTHVTNGIVIQREVHGAEPESEITPQIPSRRRALKPIIFSVENYVVGNRSLPKTGTIEPELLKPPSQQGVHKDAEDLDLVWSLLRQHTDGYKIPGWTGFNALLQAEHIPSKCNVGYCPVIDSPATKMSTVNTLIQNSVHMAEKIGQKDVIIVLDQALYSKAQEVVQQNPEVYCNVVLRMGSFHTILAFLAVLGKRFCDGGLSDILIESGIIAPGSLNGVILGNHYNRAVRAHKIVLEALLRMRWEAFTEWLKSRNILDEVTQEFQQELSTFQTDMTNESYETFKTRACVTHMLAYYNQYIQDNSGQLFQYWTSYINMVFIMLRFIRATRGGSWDLHLASVRQMLPWLFAYDKVNYSRYLSLYWCQMTTLSRTHPEAYKVLKEGEFAVQRTRNHSFSQVPVDQTIEQTINKDTKTKGGIIGMSLNKGAVHRWIVTAHDRADITRECRSMAGLNDRYSDTQDSGKERIKKDETDVMNVMTTLQLWINPFSKDNDLVNVASGLETSAKTAKDISSAHAKGEHAFSQFVTERFIDKSVNFNTPIKKLQLRNFFDDSYDENKEKGFKKAIKYDRGLFARLIVLAQNRKLDLRHVLTYSLGPYPLSLATTNGTLAKTTKASLLTLLETKVPPMDNLPKIACWIIDGMAFLQCIQDTPSTFGELALYIMSSLLAHMRQEDRRLDFVMDQYFDTSIKSAERKKRSETGTLRMNINSGSQKCPSQWKKYLSVNSNKMELSNFLFDEWCKDEYFKIIKDKEIFITHGNICHRLFTSDAAVVTEEIKELMSKQEEADTRILLHSRHASLNGAGNIVIRSPDTDVAVLACAFAQQIPANIFFQTGTKHRKRCLNMTAISYSLGNRICDALPGLHAFTGCDSTSSFVGKGKRKPFNLIETDDELAERMATLGESFLVDDEVRRNCEIFVCKMYGSSDIGINELRYKLFCSKNNDSVSLPPTQDALYEHTKRANYQAAIWKRAFVQNPDIPSPNGHGWTIENGSLSIVWMTKDHSPKGLIEMTACHCTIGCKDKRCSCLKYGLNCTDICTCSNCSNESVTPVEPEINDANISDDSDEN